MDPVSQAVVGGALAQSFAQKQTLRAATLVGACAPLLADFDVLIYSADDPLLTLDYHRHFTHALIFIPIGGLLAAFLGYFFVRKWLSFQQTLLAAVLGYSTAALLDAATSYGTYLLWPFSEARIAWSIISIIDPLFTLPLIVLCALAFYQRKAYLSRIGIIFALAYLGFGVVQHQRAEQAALALIESRAHEAQRLSVRPSFGNIVLWRVIYEHDEHFFVDAVNIGLFQKPLWYAGGEQVIVRPEQDFSELPEASILHRDIQRFAFFSDNYLSWHPEQADILGDIRFALLPNSIEPLWGIRIDYSKPAQHTEFVTLRDSAKTLWRELWRMVRRQP